MSSLARASLLLVPEHDPRPGTFNPLILDLVIKPRLPALAGWLQYRVPGLSEEMIMECARHGLVTGRGDAFAAVVELQKELNWPADAHLVLIFHEMSLAIPIAIRQAERLWQIRTGVRFPAEKGDKVEWYEDGGRRFSGEVTEIDTSRACAFVQPVVGAIRSGATRRVLAEQVTQNKTRIIGHRYLGFQVEKAESND